MESSTSSCSSTASLKEDAVEDATPSLINPDMRWYTFDEEKLAEVRRQSPWKTDPKFFQRVVVSPSAVMKMMMHCQSGVEKGIKKGGNPVEVMGLMMGRPDHQEPHTTLIVTDVFPLPIEGFETRVVVDDENVLNYMFTLQESMDRTRKEKFMGWYHSHPFDVGMHSNCFLSSTDLSTQLQWQRLEDPNGNPFLAIVVDPLRSLANNTPVLQAFRAYPPEYNSPIVNECPDGTIVHDETARLERWGSCWQRYYEISVEYYTSQQSQKIMESLTKNFLWIRTLGTTPTNEAEYVERYPERISSLANKLRSTVAPTNGSSSESRQQQQHRTTTTAKGAREGNKPAEIETDLDKVCLDVAELAKEKLYGAILQVTRENLFREESS